MATNESNKDQVFNVVRDNPGITGTEAWIKLKNVPKGSVSSQLTQGWQNKIFKRVEGPNGYGYTLAEAGEPVKPNGTKHHKRRHRKHDDTTAARVLFMVQWGKNKSDLMTMEEARTIWADLNKLFHE